LFDLHIFHYNINRRNNQEFFKKKHNIFFGGLFLGKLADYLKGAGAALEACGLRPDPS